MSLENKTDPLAFARSMIAVRPPLRLRERYWRPKDGLWKVETSRGVLGAYLVVRGREPMVYLPAADSFLRAPEQMESGGVRTLATVFRYNLPMLPPSLNPVAGGSAASARLESKFAF